jgi:hypothetical protein
MTVKPGGQDRYPDAVSDSSFTFRLRFQLGLPAWVDPATRTLSPTHSEHRAPTSTPTRLRKLRSLPTSPTVGSRTPTGGPPELRRLFSSSARLRRACPLTRPYVTVSERDLHLVPSGPVVGTLGSKLRLKDH